MLTIETETDAAEVETQSDEFSRQYTVSLLYQDRTPMLFIIELLERFFYFPREVAILKTMDGYQLRQSIKCGVYSKEEAEEKKNAVEKYAKEQHYSVKCIVK